MRYLIDSKTGRRTPHANLSRFHPDFGCTPAEHERRKAARLAGKLAFEPIETRRRKGVMTKAARVLSGGYKGGLSL